MNVTPLITLFTHNSNAVATKFIQRPQITRVAPEALQHLRLAGDELCLSTKKKVISLDEVKNLFPEGKLTDNYITRTINELIPKVETTRKIIDMTPELSEKDYKIIQKFMNMDNGRYIEQWKGYFDTDIVPNMQKLALFTRTMRLTKQTNEFLDFTPDRWEFVYDGIVRKPLDTLLPVLKYKINSDPINGKISSNEITKEVKTNIDKITEFLNMFTVKKDFVGYRGDKSFRILSGIKYEGQNFSLAELMEAYTKNFQSKYQANAYNKNVVDKFIQKYVIDQDVVQSRFMSIGMTESAVKDYAKKIKWNITIPAGTKGASIESYNIERLNEAEFLGQRNGVLKIRNATYCPKKDLWYFKATLEQKPVDEIVVNC